MGSKACVQTKATIKLLSHTKVLVVLVFIWIWIDGNQDWDNRSLDKQLHKEDHEIRANTLLILVVRQKTCNKESEILVTHLWVLLHSLWYLVHQHIWEERIWKSLFSWFILLRPLLQWPQFSFIFRRPLLEHWRKGVSILLF